MKTVKITEVFQKRVVGEELETGELLELIVTEGIAAAFQKDLYQATENDLIIDVNSEEFNISAFDHFLLERLSAFQQSPITEMDQWSVKLLLEIREKFIELLYKAADTQPPALLTAGLQEGDQLDAGEE